MAHGRLAVTLLLEALPGRRVHGTLPISVTGIASDSRRVAPGDCFVAVPGFTQDARRFASDAVRRGASVVVVAHAAAPWQNRRALHPR
jgi:UDP-N-acetylmuramyl pentapeptide synthase